MFGREQSSDTARAPRTLPGLTEKVPGADFAVPPMHQGRVLRAAALFARPCPQHFSRRGSVCRAARRGSPISEYADAQRGHYWGPHKIAKQDPEARNIIRVFQSNLSKMVFRRVFCCSGSGGSQRKRCTDGTVRAGGLHNTLEEVVCL